MVRAPRYTPRERPGRCSGGRALPELTLLALTLLAPLAAQAQIADVARPDARGEFTRIRIAGPRGWLVQRFWLVVDRDPQGLLCRDEHGRALLALRYGSVVELDRPDLQQSPQWIDAKPYLHLSVDPIAVLRDARLEPRGRAVACRVRANSAFVAPIQLESLQRAQLRP